MLTTHDSSGDKGLTIAAATNECFRSFRKCIETASSVNPKELSMIEEQTARFRGWTISAAVFNPRSASMDHHLRQYAPEVHSAVTGLLESLNYQCQECLESLTLILESSERDQEKIPDNGLLKSLNAIATEISRLDKISNTIRRASMDKQPLTASDFYVKDDEGNNAEETLLGAFHRHVDHRFPSLGLTIQDRLARAMVLRRRQILYRKYRQDQVCAKSEDHFHAAKAVMSFEKSRSIDSKTDGTISKSATTNSPEMNRATLSAISVSEKTGLRDSENLMFTLTAGDDIKRRYEQLKRQRQDAFQEDSSFQNDEAEGEATVQPLLPDNMQGLGEIICPYCLCLLPVEDAFDEINWRNHVVNDLDSYVCVFENCDRPNVLYSDLDQWLNHLQQHCAIWRCPSHRELEPFSSSKDYITHMREVHATKLSDKQLRILASKISLNAKLFPTCPLCGKRDFDNDEHAENHVAGHLRLLAMESLPRYHEYLPAFDLCRLVALIENPERCEGRKRLHIEGLLNCAHPPIKLRQLRLEDYDQKEPKIFFSRARLNGYFGPYVKELLDCKCQECTAARDDDIDMMWVLEKKSQIQGYPWIFGFMIFLGKLHYIYYWMKWEFADSGGGLDFAVMDDTRLAQLIKSEMDRRIFQQAYERTISMFYPMTFEIQDDETCPYRDLPDFCRFPYLKEESISINGFYRAMTKVEILPEHLDRKIIDLVTERYPTTGTNSGSDRKFLFALKSVTTNPDSPLKSMERNILDMVSRIESPASDNMITVLFVYNWRDQIHFLFPFIEMNLDHVLRHKKCPVHRSSRLRPDEHLHEHWLWQEMNGVCCALSVFHSKMKNPFPDKKGIVIGLHFDLKPANILVTANGKLKITDFGQSLIQILNDEEHKTVPQRPGDCRYSAPESRPTLNYSSDRPEDIEVLLNYDVWSLGCIMVEVLIHMLDQQTLETFDKRLDEEKGEEKAAGFFTDNVLKPCVISSLEGFQRKFANGDQTGYMEAVTKLLRAMLSLDVKDRPYSWEVFGKLKEENAKLTESRPNLDRIKPEVERYELLEGKGFREMGCDNEDSVVSFADMAGITLELIHQTDGRSEKATPCRIRLFRKFSRKMTEPVVCLVWGVERGVNIEMKQRQFEVSQACFSPTYLFKNEATGNGRFECRLFPIKGSDLAFIFEFESLEDVLIFQGTLLQRKIHPPIRAKVIEVTPKSKLTRTYPSPEFNDETSHIQLWAICEPKYLKSAGSNANETKSIVPTASSSTALIRPPGNEQCSTMVIFFEFLSPWVMSLNDGRKLFENGGKSQGKPCVKIVYRKDHRHQSFTVTQLPAQPAWRGQNTKESPHTSSSILLNADYENMTNDELNKPFKLHNAKFVLENTTDRDRLCRGTSKEWRIHGAPIVSSRK